MNKGYAGVILILAVFLMIPSVVLASEDNSSSDDWFLELAKGCSDWRKFLMHL